MVVPLAIVAWRRSQLPATEEIAVDAGAVGEHTTPKPADAFGIRLRVQGIQESKGRLMVAVFANEANFPDYLNAMRRQAFETGDANEQSIDLEPLAMGTYALAVYLDVNGDNQLNRAALGYPIEPYGFSNNARSTFGPPAFGEAAFRLHAGSTQMEITLK